MSVSIEKSRQYSYGNKVADDYIMLTIGFNSSVIDLIDHLSNYKEYVVESVENDILTLYKEDTPTPSEIDKARKVHEKYKAVRYQQYLQMKKEFEPNAEA